MVVVFVFLAASSGCCWPCCFSRRCIAAVPAPLPCKEEEQRGGGCSAVGRGCPCRRRRQTSTCIDKTNTVYMAVAEIYVLCSIIRRKLKPINNLVLRLQFHESQVPTPASWLCVLCSTFHWRTVLLRGEIIYRSGCTVCVQHFSFVCMLEITEMLIKRLYIIIIVLWWGHHHQPKSKGVCFFTWDLRVIYLNKYYYTLSFMCSRL